MKCSHCGKEVPDSAKVCGYCGTKLEKKRKQPCPECGKELPARAKVCGYCGASLEKPAAISKKAVPETAAPAPPKTVSSETAPFKLPKWIVPAGLIAVGLTAAALILLVLFKPSSQPKTAPEAPQEPSASQVEEAPAVQESEAEPAPELAAPLPKEVTAVLDGAQTLYYSDCSEMDSNFFYIQEFKENVYSEDGMIITGTEGMFFTGSDIVPGNAVLVKFMMKADDETEWMMMSIDAGNTDNFQSMGISATLGDFTNDVFHGDPEVDGNLTEYRFSGMEEIDFDKWYYTLFAVLEDGQVYLRVWPESYPSEYIERTEDFEIPSQKDTWYYVQDIVGSGFIYIDDFWTLEFDSIRSDEDAALGNLPDAINDILVDFKSIYYSDCGNIDDKRFDYDGDVSVDDGKIIVDADGSINLSWIVSKGLEIKQAVLVKFMIKPNPEIPGWNMIGIDINDKGKRQAVVIASDGHTFGIFPHHKESPDAGFIALEGFEEIDSDLWYYAIFAPLDVDRVYLRFWQDGNPSRYAEAIENFEIADPDSSWGFDCNNTYSGSVHLDDYWVLEFDSIRSDEDTAHVESSSIYSNS